ncbi:MAG: hypothetical protein OXT74_17870 [Candidatus Poribacteria bacterium]|nr:hypothetical protein [Candidatus Poribacteria bacterium]
MKTVVLIATPIILLTFMFVAAAYAFDVKANCQRTLAWTTIPPGLPFLMPVNEAKSAANNSGLTHGMIAVDADAGGTPAFLSTSFSTTAISWSVSGQGPWSSSGSADAYVEGRIRMAVSKSTGTGIQTNATPLKRLLISKGRLWWTAKYENVYLHPHDALTPLGVA